MNFTETRESGFLRFWHLKKPPFIKINPISQGAFEKEYRLSLLQDFAMRQ
ncbi:hypothetical protein T3H00_21905 [Pseudomonas fluorescens]|nr:MULTISPECIES: hypothetical protein [Pseudomonas]MDZ5435306.1 hypothetical protein [Pseudomonas fluorescens]